MCGTCFESRVQPEDVPRVLEAMAKKPSPTVDLNPECKCHHPRSQHVETGCVSCRMNGIDLLANHRFIGPNGPEGPGLSTNEVCRCGHIRFRHQREDAEDRHCSLPSCPCTDFEQKAKPEESDPCQHPNRVFTGSLYDGPGGRKSWLYYTCSDCNLKWREEEAGEPPLTPEEEEEVAQDWTCANKSGCYRQHTDDCENGCRHAADALAREAHEDSHEGLHDELPPPEGPEYTPCVCGHTQPEHEPNHGELCMVKGCECAGYRTTPDFELPPRPDRRPPYAVSYSVQGHLYEVALSGDASVRAIDGALVIQHHLGPVAGIVQVLPVINEEQG
jgi:hypothetical protein